MVRPTILMRGRVDPDGERDKVSKDNGCNRDQEGQKKAITDHLADREVIGKGVAQIALNQTANPIEVLLPEWAVETIFHLQVMDLG